MLTLGTLVRFEGGECPACDGTGQDMEKINPVTFGATDCSACGGAGVERDTGTIDRTSIKTGVKLYRVKDHWFDRAALTAI